MSVFANAQTNKPAADYLNVHWPVMFDNSTYNLNWRAHPAANFYKHEYLIKGEDANKYKKMLMMDVMTGETNIKNTVEAKIAEIKKLKEGNPIINYEVMNNVKTGEYLPDFLLSVNAPDGTISIIERNVYHYKTFTDNNGHKGVLLFAVSTRA